jgi:hypothetical protein
LVQGEFNLGGKSVIPFAQATKKIEILTVKSGMTLDRLRPIDYIFMRLEGHRKLMQLVAYSAL